MIGRFGVAIIAGLAAALASTGAARAQTQIATCPYAISAPGNYVLAADLTCSGDGIDVKASNIKLMLNDYIITGPNNGSAIGINISFKPSYTNIQIQGPGLIQKFATGIYLVNVQNSQIQNLIAALNGGGIYSNTGGVNNHFQQNVFAQNGFLSGGRGDGITLQNETSSQVQNNDASGNNGSGIADFGTGNQIHNNNTGGNGMSGIGSSASIRHCARPGSMAVQSCT